MLLSPGQVLGTAVSAYLINNMWVIIAALLIFAMAVAIGFRGGVGELGNSFESSFLKTVAITATALLVMAVVGFNTAFVPTIYGIIGNPFFREGLFLGAFSPYPGGLI